MANELVQPDRFFLSRFGLTERAFERTLGTALERKADYADLFFEFRSSEALTLEESIVSKTAKSISQGVGVRVCAEDRTGYAYSDEVTVDRMRLAAETARAIADQHGEKTGAVQVGARTTGHELYAIQTSPTEIPIREKVRLLEEIDRAARAVDPRVKMVVASFAAEDKVVMVVNSEGRLAADRQPLCRLNVSVIAEDGANRQTGTFGGGGRVEWGYFLEDERWRQYAQEAARQALINLEAIDAPAGEMVVVLGPGWPGVLLHEAVGHGLEGDFNRKKTSTFSGRIGQRVASELCTVVDDGTIPSRRGSINIDDEGIPTRRNVLIENGILRGYLQDRLNARLMSVEPTGNGRRESFAHIPMPRMTNTFMLAGDCTREEIIRSVDRGLYAVNFGGGQVDITSGRFVFSASEAYLIEDGHITRPVKGATLIGNGPEVLTRVSMVGNDLELDAGVGTCGKNGQSVPVGVGMPTIKIDALTVGGTRAA
ncbi:MAG TPA: metalloprotease TldD [Candidatus Binataceae bacterium]|jgi:TldD protein|nr:metalloprotease TldD [Candidatus Binataceae bacterium]HZY58249.1 metalloprotease TldD [Candidatus Binataceae bacterium]